MLLNICLFGYTSLLLSKMEKLYYSQYKIHFNVLKCVLIRKVCFLESNLPSYYLSSFQKSTSLTSTIYIFKTMDNTIQNCLLQYA